MRLKDLFCFGPCIALNCPILGEKITALLQRNSIDPALARTRSEFL